LSSGQESFTGSGNVNNCLKLMFLALLAKPVTGFGQQAQPSRLESLLAAAQQAQAAHDYTTAENSYLQAIKIQPNMPELWSNLGLMQQEAGEISPAILSFRQADRLNPSLYVPNLFLGIDLLRTEKAAEAIPFLLKAEKTNKTDSQPPLALGRAYISTGKFSAAAQELSRAIEIDPKLSSAWFALGIARLDQVEVDSRRMSEDEQDSPFAKALFAESLEKQARFSEAAAQYRSVIAATSQPPCIHSELGFSLLRDKNIPGAATEFAAERAAHPECGLAVLGQARMAIDAGQSDQAIKLLQELWNRDHGFVEANAAILLDGLSSERLSAVLDFLAEPNTPIAADLRSALLAAISGSGQAPGGNASPLREAGAPPATGSARTGSTAEQFYAAGDFQQCTRRLDGALASGNGQKLKLLATCSFFAGDNERASSAASALAALQPHSPEALYWSIQANQRLAFKALARFQQLEPDSAKSHLLLGDIYRQRDRFDDAQGEYSKALALTPGDTAALFGLASAYLSDNNIEKAKETAQAALAGSPDDPELNLIMAETMISRHEYEQAEPYLLKSLHAKPQMLPRMHALIGKAYAETGRVQEAIVQLKLGASSDEDGSVQYFLARLYRQLGDTKDASEALNRMKSIKQERRDRGVKIVGDPDLAAFEPPSGDTSTP
jgi:tetratricopeptide (TPR) repeat protein